MNCLIILNGDKPQNANLEDIVKDMDIIICADGGARWAHEARIEVDAIIGDLDSVSEDVIKAFENSDTKIIKAPQEKDETDGVLAIDYAILRGATDITIIGAAGGRLDHQYGNIMLLKRLLDAKCKGRMLLDNGYAIVCNGNVEIACNIGDTISIVPFDGELVINSSQGLQFAIDKDTSFKYGYPIGLSNIAVDSKVSVDITSGCALIFFYSI